MFNQIILATVYISAVMSGSKEGGGEVTFRLTSLNNFTCSQPSQIGEPNLKSTRCKIHQGSPVCCGGADHSNSASAFDVCWRYNYVADQWSQIAGLTLSQPKFANDMTELGDGRLWIAGKRY